MGRAIGLILLLILSGIIYLIKAGAGKVTGKEVKFQDESRKVMEKTARGINWMNEQWEKAKSTASSFPAKESIIVSLTDKAMESILLEIEIFSDKNPGMSVEEVLKPIALKRGLRDFEIVNMKEWDRLLGVIVLVSVQQELIRIQIETKQGLTYDPKNNEIVLIVAKRFAENMEKISIFARQTTGFADRN